MDVLVDAGRGDDLMSDHRGRSRGGRCSVFLTMRFFNDAMFSNS